MAISSSRLPCALAFALAFCCSVQAAPRQDTVHFFTVENDAGFDTDRYYTSGLQFSRKRSFDTRGRTARSLTSWPCKVLGCDGNTVLTSQTSIGQLIFTPQDITINAPQPSDRPWAGLLYAEQAYAFLSPDQRTLTTLTGTAGFTGRLSLAEPVQKAWHQLIDRPAPRGWDNQIGTRFGLMASAERRTALEALSLPLSREVQLNTATYWRIAAGNIQTYAAAGVAVVIGKDLPPVSPPPPGIGNKVRAGKGIPTACLVSWVQCTGFASVEGQLVAYNVFLDERRFRSHPHVKRRNFVRNLVLGTRFDFPGTRSASHGPWFVQFKVTRRSPEFRSSIPIPRHRVAAVTIGTEF